MFCSCFFLVLKMCDSNIVQELMEKQDDRQRCFKLKPCKSTKIVGRAINISWEDSNHCQIIVCGALLPFLIELKSFGKVA